jgi:hypothetical protein
MSDEWAADLAVIDGDEQVGALDLSFGRYQSYEES